jgi:ketosteroid isomerase-like protein
MAALYQPDITYWSSISGYTRGSEEVIGHIRELFRHLPDEQMTPERVITNGSVIVVEFVSRGTGPEDRPYEIRFTEVMRLRDGLLAEIKVYIDPDEVPMPAAD